MQGREHSALDHKVLAEPPYVNGIRFVNDPNVLKMRNQFSASVIGNVYYMLKSTQGDGS